MARVKGALRVDEVCFVYERARIPGRDSQRGLRLVCWRARRGHYLRASLVREPSLAQIWGSGWAPPTEAWASLDDSMWVRGRGQEGK